MKLVAWWYTGSYSMFSECIHSAADTANQLILAYGIHKSVQVIQTAYFAAIIVLSLHYFFQLLLSYSVKNNY